MRFTPRSSTQKRRRAVFDAAEARLAALHARWVRDALEAGPVKALQPDDLDAAFQKGLDRAKARRSASGCRMQFFFAGARLC
jgi:hypothetical protein